MRTREWATRETHSAQTRRLPTQPPGAEPLVGADVDSQSQTLEMHRKCYMCISLSVS